MLKVNGENLGKAWEVVKLKVSVRFEGFWGILKVKNGKFYRISFFKDRDFSKIVVKGSSTSHF